MSLISSAFSFLGGTKVTEKNNTITIDGVRTPVLTVDLQSKWKTSTVGNYIFKKMRKMSLEFNSFFAPDIYYIFQTLINDKRTRTKRSVLKDVVAQLVTNTWLSSALSATFTSKLDFGALSRLTVTLLPHQMEFLRTYDEMTQRWKLNGYILGAAPGAGKTICAISLAECLNSDVTICIVPKNAVERVWVDTLGWVFKQAKSYWYSTSNEALPTNAHYYVSHFEQLDKMVEFFRTNHKGKNITIILDESHNFNELKSARTQMFIELVKVTGSKNVIWSSGTPIKAMGSEVIPVLKTIDPFFGPEEEDRFKKVFGVSTARALDILAHRLGYMTFKVDKKEVVGNTVMKYRVDVKVPEGKKFTLSVIKEEMGKFVKERVEYYLKNMASYIAKYKAGLAYHESTLRSREEKQEFADYKAMADDMHRGFDPVRHKTEPNACNSYEKKKIIPFLPKELKEDFLAARSVYKYMDLKVKGEALGRILGKKRVECALAMLQGHEDYVVTDTQTGDKYDFSLIEIVDNATAKTVVFTSYVEVVDEAAAIFKKAGAKPLKVYGQTNHELPQIVGVFDKDKSANPLVATLQSLSTAVPLVRANTVVFLNAPFRIHEYDQACSRVDRLGQKETVHIFEVYLDTGEEPNISTRSLEIMAWSNEMVEAMLGKSSSTNLAALEDLCGDLGELDSWTAAPAPQASSKPALEGFSW